MNRRSAAFRLKPWPTGACARTGVFQRVGTLFDNSMAARTTIVEGLVRRARRQVTTLRCFIGPLWFARTPLPSQLLQSFRPRSMAPERPTYSIVERHEL